MISSIIGFHEQHLPRRSPKKRVHSGVCWQVAPGLTVELKLRGRHGAETRNPGLAAAEYRLAELQTLYRLGQYSGHSQEMLEDFEHADKTVRRLRSGSAA